MKNMPQPIKRDTADNDAEPKVELDKAELPDAQSLRDAIKQWRHGDDVADVPVGSEASEEAVSANKASNSPKKKVSRNQARRYARQRALQALYQWDCGDVDVGDVLGQFKEHQNLNNVDLVHFQRLFRGVALSVDDVDAILEPALDRPVTDLDPIERSVLRLACVELKECLDTPARVVINEAVELTKRFGADQGHKYVNGVIDKVALVLRETEMKAGGRS